MAYPMFIYSIVAFIILLSSTNASSNLMKAKDSNGKSFVDGLGVVSPGQSITIECNIEENISWTRRDLKNEKIEKLQTNEKIKVEKNKLTIKDINFSDASVYYCEQAGTVYRFYLYVYAITSWQNGTVPLTKVSVDMNGLKFDQLKINEKVSANVSCTCDSGSVSTDVVINWKGGSYVNKVSDKYSIKVEKNGSSQTNILILTKPQVDKSLYGEYSCFCNAVTGALKEKKVYLTVPPIFDNYERSVRTIEGEDVWLSCQVWGYPDVTEPIQWRFQNSTEFRKGIKIISNYSHSGISQLFIPAATQSDRGVYSCHAINSVGSNVAISMVRVKGRYAALWPFIGIVVQVIILAAIIIIYEWKKSHKSQDTSCTVNYDTKADQDPTVAIRSGGGDQADIRQRLMVN